MVMRQRHIKNAFLSVAFIITCNVFITYVAGARWSEWTAWKECSVTCGRGHQNRYRTCEHTASTRNQGTCTGKYVDTIICNTHLECPVDGGWSEWSRWSPCSVTCGEGIMEKKRACDSPEPVAGGENCKGSKVESQGCFNSRHCPRDGKWSRWGEWSQCSVTCGQGGTKQRNRECNNPPPAKDGRPCEGLPYSRQPCQAEVECPVNGQWSDWSNWTECSTSCGAGEKRRYRKCDQPAPQHGGDDCDRSEGGEVEIVSCNGDFTECPTNGGWSDWSDWGGCYKANCSARHETAYMMQQRSCNSPLPANDGAMCQGIFINASICFNPINCKVNGGWSAWSDWVCSVDVVARNRTCTNPAPANGGRDCQEDSQHWKNVEFYPIGSEIFLRECPHINIEKEEENEEEDEQVDGSGGNFGSDQEYGPEEDYKEDT